MDKTTQILDPNINLHVSFAQGHIPELLRKLENFVGIPLSLRSNSGEVVCKTDYFFGPCSIIRGTEIGRQNCRKTYQNIEQKLFNRKSPYVNICYAGFLIFAVPLEFRGEMIGTLFGAQILPQKFSSNVEITSFFENLIGMVRIKDRDSFCKSFLQVKSLEPDFQRINFLQFLTKIGENFVEMAFSDKTWPIFYRAIKDDIKPFGLII
ncbi:MAG: PocR ligand-binding domain-containing protein [Candidatus Riflebacteria bacterium]|nr:PocR ligand-binding domain-containing protein [Candidatus Riflebacteria bacterium]